MHEDVHISAIYEINNKNREANETSKINECKITVHFRWVMVFFLLFLILTFIIIKALATWKYFQHNDYLKGLENGMYTMVSTV